MTTTIGAAVQAIIDSMAYLWDKSFTWLRGAFMWLWDLVADLLTGLWDAVLSGWDSALSILPEGWANALNLSGDMDPATPGVQSWGYYFSGNGVAGTGGSSVLTYFADIGWILPVPAMVAMALGAYTVVALIRATRWMLSLIPTLNTG